MTGKHIYDLAWSPDSEFLIAGSTDNTASIWKAGTGMSLSSLSGEWLMSRRGRKYVYRSHYYQPIAYAVLPSAPPNMVEQEAEWRREDNRVEDIR